MRLLRKHLLSNLAAPFLFAWIAQTAMLILNQLARQLGELVGKGLPARVIVEVLILFIPFIVALSLPMAVLVAVLYGFSQMGADNELTAMRANGVSVYQMVRPVLVAGLLMTLANFLFIDQVLPRGNLRLLSLRTDIAQKKPTFALREQAINSVPQSLYFLRASRIEPGTGRMREVVIYDMSPPAGRRVIYADSGLMAFAQNNQDLRIDLYSGEVHEYSTTQPTSFTLTRFVLNEVTVRNVQNAFRQSAGGVSAGDREMTTCQMIDKVSGSREQILRVRDRRARIAENGVRSLLRLTAPPDSATVPAARVPPHCAALWRRFERWVGRALLPPGVQAQSPPGLPPDPQPAATRDTVLSLMERARLATPVPSPTLSEVNDVRDQEAMVRGEVRQYTVEIHKKFSLSVACTTFVLIGIALALRFPRGGMGLVIGASLVIFAVFYVGLTVGENLGDKGVMDPAFAMWLPNLIVLGVGILGLLRVNREFGSTRGGDLADLTDFLFGWIRFRRKARA
jgi:lipopolysaccharide export system permease protein